MKNNISLLVGLRNNLDYNKHFYKTTRELYPDVEICFVSYGSTDGTHNWLDELNDSNVKYFYSNESKTFSDTFNKAAEIATKEYVAYLHNDIVLTPNFIENIEKYISDKRIVSYTTIEPPIFAGHERPGKLIYDLGTDLQTFDKSNLYSFSSLKQSQYKDKTESGITFFMCIPKNILLQIGGMDNLYNPMFCEDDDLINRFKLLGFELITSLDAICYHFVSKTSRFSTEYQLKTNEIEFLSNRNYTRKWGLRGNISKYDIAIRIRNCNPHLLSILEPYFTTTSVDCDFINYIQSNQINTKFDLSKRVVGIGTELNNDIVVEFDGNLVTNDNLNILVQMSSMIDELNGEVGEYEVDIYKIKIKAIENHIDKLTHIDNPYYTSQLIS